MSPTRKKLDRQGRILRILYVSCNVVQQRIAVLRHLSSTRISSCPSYLSYNYDVRPSLLRRMKLSTLDSKDAEIIAVTVLCPLPFVSRHSMTLAASALFFHFGLTISWFFVLRGMNLQ